MNSKMRFLFAIACALTQMASLRSDDLAINLAADHGTAVLKEIVNRTSQPVLIRFEDSAYPPLKANDSTDSFGGENIPLKATAVGGSMLLMGIVGMLAMKSNPTSALAKVQARVNKPAESYASKVNAEKNRLNGTDEPEKDKKSSTEDETIKARAAAEKKWADFSKKHRETEDAELEKKLKSGTISAKEIAKIKDERKVADAFQDKMSESQKRGGLLNTIWVDTKNTKNDLQNERENFSRETNQAKGMLGLNTAQEREDDKAFHQALERMTPSEKKAAQELRDQEKKTPKEKTSTDKAAERDKFWQSMRDQGGFNKPDGSAMSKAQMTKTVLGRMAGFGEKKEPIEKEIKTRKEKAAKGLMYGIGALVAAIPPTLVALSEQIGDTPANMMVSMIPWEIPDGKFRCPVTKQPLLVGFGSTLIPTFPEGGILKIKRMLGLGAAWLKNPLPTPLSFTLTFKLRISDEGGAHIMLREGLDFSKATADDVGFKTKIILGGFGNTVTAISDKGTLVAKISREEYPAAAIPPGIFTPYWLSYDKGLILIGLGQPGTNVILSWHDPDFSPTINHIGLSCDKSTVEFTELYFSPAIASTPAIKSYVQKTEEMVLSESTSWLKERLREPGSGTVSFQKLGGAPAIIKLALDDTNNSAHIKIPIGSKYSESMLLCTKDPVTGNLTEEEIGVVCDPYPFNENEYESYWVSNLYGQITVGHSQPTKTSSGQKRPGNPGTNLIACVTAPDLAQAATLGFASDPDGSDKKVVIKNIGIHPATELQENIPPGYVERRKFMGMLQTIYPFAYQFRQADQSVEVHDQISGETWYPAATPQQMATYFFNTTIDSAGSITMKERGSSKNPIKFGMAAAATALQQAAGLLNTTATQVGQSGTDVISQIITAAASIGLASVAMGTNISAGILTANAKYGFRDKNSYVYTEKVTAEQNTESSLPQEVLANKTTIEGIITEAASYKKSLLERFDFNTLSQANVKMLADGARAPRALADRHTEQLKFFELFVTSHKQILSLINHPSIGSNPMIKKNFAEGLFFINETVQMLYNGPTDGPQKTIVTDAIIGLFTAAQQNTFLLNNALNDDRNRTKLWTSWIQNLAGSALNAPTTQGFSLNSMFGQYLWLNDPLILPDSKNGSIYIEAQGLGDLFVGIIDEPSDVRNSEKDLYEVVFGGTNNTKTFLRVKSLGRSVTEISNSENINASVDPLSTEKFWVSIKNGTISAGKGEWGTGKLIEWTDPYPLENARRIGISSWNNPIIIKNIRTGPAIEDLTPQIRTAILTTDLNKKQSAEAVAKTLLMKDKFTDLEEKDVLVHDVLKENDFEKNDRLAFDLLMLPEADQLTYDILQDTIDRAAGGKPKTLDPAQKLTAKDKTGDKKKSDKTMTAAEQKEKMMQMTTGGLGGLFQEKQQLLGRKFEGDKTFSQKIKDALKNTRNIFRKRATASKSSQAKENDATKTMP